jgi:anti-sigma regulatory factor (Ser/Thr protein kinase)
VTVVPAWPPGSAFKTLRQNRQLINDDSGHGSASTRILGEVPSTGEAVPWGGWVRYETAINHVYADLPVTMLCPYDRRTTPAWVLDDVEHTHPFLTGAGDRPVSNAGFLDPAAFLGDLAARDRDPIESEAPTLELVDQLPGASRRSVAALAENTELDRSTIDALSLAVGEVATNAVIHGQPPVVLRAWALPDRVVVSVLDHGSGPTDPFVGMLPLDNAPTGGLGLHVVYQTCSLVTMSRTASDFTVHLTMRRSPAE